MIQKRLCHWQSRLSVCLSVLFFIISSAGAMAQSSVWKISKADKTLYLAGTIHILEAADYPLPPEFEQAYHRADKVVFETDIAQARSAQFAQRMLQELTYPPGQSLRQHLDKNTYEALTAYFSDIIPMTQIDGLKPAMVVLMLSSIEYQRMGMVLAGVDEYFWQRAQRDRKPAIALESLDEQLGFIVNMGKGNEAEMIRNALDEARQAPAIIMSLKNSWRAGDQKTMEQLILQDMIDSYPELYNEFLVYRNHNWLPRLLNMMEDDSVELVLVGALHLFGEDGLLRLLRQQGYQVSHL